MRAFRKESKSCPIRLVPVIGLMWTFLACGGGAAEAPVGVAVRFAAANGLSEVKTLYFMVAKEGSAVPLSGGEICAGASALSSGDGAGTVSFVVPAAEELTVVVAGCDGSGCGIGGCSGRTLWRGETHHVTAVEKASKPVDVFMTRTGNVTRLEGEGLLRGAAFHTATVLGDGRVLIAGGFINAVQGTDEKATNKLQATNDAYIYYPQRGVVEPVVGGMKSRRAMHTATLTPEGMVLMIGGVKEALLDSGSCGELPLRELENTWVPQTEFFNPKDNTFYELSRYGSYPRAGHTASVLGSYLLLAGGRRFPQGDEVLFCPLLLTKTPACLGKKSTPRFGHTTIVFGPAGSELALLLGGNDAKTDVDESFNAELFHSTDGNLSEAPFDEMPPYFHTASRVKADEGYYGFLVAGGYRKLGVDFAGPSRDSLFYVLPAQGGQGQSSLTPTGGMLSNRAIHSATSLDDGTVILAGGLTDCETGEAADTIELFRAENPARVFEPAKGANSAEVKMSTPRFGHTATLLDDGTVLFAGGFDVIPEGRVHSGEALGSLDIYSPMSEKR